ncbi:unnamed protein product [Somion occarium]|uniref:DUF427 domain-containing protein n=1 Tax=Somion occarium TaxID=3059160 RepID=A0ABP1DZ33_9APHY
MVKAIVNGKVLAESDFFSPSSTSSVCPWKGTAAYYDATIDGNTIKDVAWYYPEPKAAASNIKDHVAFYKNKVTIEA